MPKLGPKLPLIRHESHGCYGLIEKYSDMVKQHVKMIVLTSPGEKMMNPSYGVGIKRFLFQNNSNSLVESRIRSEIQSQMNKYMSYVDVLDIQISQEKQNQNRYNIRLFYKVKPLNINIQQDLLITGNM
jgi:phage baseplate assembly protein W